MGQSHLGQSPAGPARRVLPALMGPHGATRVAPAPARAAYSVKRHRTIDAYGRKRSRTRGTLTVTDTRVGPCLAVPASATVPPGPARAPLHSTKLACDHLARRRHSFNCFKLKLSTAPQQGRGPACICKLFYLRVRRRSTVPPGRDRDGPSLSHGIRVHSSLVA
jgi:hypothetical protein